MIATGADEYRPTEYLYGKDDRVLTQLELEERISKGDERLLTYRSLVMIQCVGGRNEEHPYCSRLCCCQAVKNALEIKKINPDLELKVFPDYTGAQIVFRTASPGEDGASKMAFNPGNISNG